MGFGPLCPASAAARRRLWALAWFPLVRSEECTRFRLGPLSPSPEGAGSRLRAEAPSRTGARRPRSLLGCGAPRQCLKKSGRQRAHLHQVSNHCSQRLAFPPLPPGKPDFRCENAPPGCCPWCAAGPKPGCAPLDGRRLDASVRGVLPPKRLPPRHPCLRPGAEAPRWARAAEAARTRSQHRGAAR